MGNAPVNLDQALAAFSDVYSPRIVAQVNDYAGYAAGHAIAPQPGEA